ncbi:MAG: hypothetical protein OEW34_04800 [Burkholderiaceae bacterium]|jgi:hypothetical protein|nr:hypothetical protein [Burkholderiaceae bacterium]
MPQRAFGKEARQAVGLAQIVAPDSEAWRAFVRENNVPQERGTDLCLAIQPIQTLTPT